MSRFDPKRLSLYNLDGVQAGDDLRDETWNSRRAYLSLKVMKFCDVRIGQDGFAGKRSQEYHSFGLERRWVSRP
jgi:hypothetical protein